jgi:hypothetical protein
MHAGAQAAPLRDTAGVPPPNLPSNSLLERDEELRALRSAATDAAGRRGRLVVVQGPAGIGKSALLGALPGLVGAGVTIRAASGSDLETHFAYGIVRQLFEPALGDNSALLDGAAGQAAPVFATGGPPATEMGVLHGLYWLTGQPL